MSSASGVLDLAYELFVRRGDIHEAEDTEAKIESRYIVWSE